MVAGSVFSRVAHHEEFAAASGPQEHTGGIAGKTSSDEAPLRSPRAMYHQGELELELELFILELTQYQDEASEKMRVRFQDCADFPHHVARLASTTTRRLQCSSSQGPMGLWPMSKDV